MRPTVMLARLLFGIALAAGIGVGAVRGSPAGTTQSASAPPELIPARVDERVELLSIIFRLADAFEYHQTPGTVPYAREADKHFAPFKNHEAVRLANKLRQDHGLGFDAVARFGLYLKGNPHIEPVVPFDDPRIEMPRCFSAQTAAEFVAALQRFADDSHAFEFMKTHHDLYGRAAQRLAAEVAKRPYREWLTDFFGAAPGAEFCAIVGMLNGGANYGVWTHFPGRPEEIMPVIGAHHFDPEGVPVFGSNDAKTVAHEFCHSYCNPFVDRHADRLLPSADRIFPYRRTLMTRQAYGDPRYMMHEAMVRACTNRFLRAHGTRAEADEQLRDEVRRGFLWTPDLSALLGEFERSRNQYPTFDSFAPRVIQFFDGVAASMDDRMARLPHVKGLSPASGTNDVNPSVSELRIEFDRPMRSGSFAIMGEAGEMPEMPEPGQFRPDLRTFVQPVVLRPGKTYVFRLNDLYRPGFVSDEGMPLDELPVTFTTTTP